MKKLAYLLCGVAAMFAFSSCDPKNNQGGGGFKDIDSNVYVVGEATAVASIDAEKDVLKKAAMAEGINEATGEARESMYEKYVALEANKDFQLVAVDGEEQTVYGAALEEKAIDGSDDQINATVLTGVLAENAKMQVKENGLYHIVMDTELNVVYVIPVKWGVRGVNGDWGWKEMTASEFNKESMTFTIHFDNIKTGEFKYAYSNGWKLVLDEEATVKVNTNLGADLVPGAGNIAISAQENSDITLTWTLKGGDIKEGYAHEVKGTTVVVDPTKIQAGVSGNAFSTTDAGEWADPKDGSTLAVFDAENSKYDATSFDGTFVYNLTNLTFDGEKMFKFRFDGGWFAYDQVVLTGDTENFSKAESDGNILVKATKKYNVAISVEWKEGKALSYTLNFVVAE